MENNTNEGFYFFIRQNVARSCYILLSIPELSKILEDPFYIDGEVVYRRSDKKELGRLCYRVAKQNNK